MSDEKHDEWHRDFWSPQADGGYGSYVYCRCSNGRHHPDYHLTLGYLNARTQLEERVRVLEGLLEAFDEAMSGPIRLPIQWYRNHIKIALGSEDD